MYLLIEFNDKQASKKESKSTETKKLAVRSAGRKSSHLHLLIISIDFLFLSATAFAAQFSGDNAIPSRHVTYPPTNEGNRQKYFLKKEFPAKSLDAVGVAWGHRPLWWRHRRTEDGPVVVGGSPPTLGLL